jgi:hypothetical protein
VIEPLNLLEVELGGFAWPNIRTGRVCLAQYIWDPSDGKILFAELVYYDFIQEETIQC